MSNLGGLSSERVAEIERLLAEARSPRLRLELRDGLKAIAAAMPLSPAVIDAQVEAQVTLFLETDRGCVLVGGAFLDEQLARLLRAAMIETGIVEQLLKPGGMLGEFMGRAKAAYSFGLIGKIAYAELETIAQIRNKCAHVLDASSFEWIGFAELTAKLRFLIPVPMEDTPRRRFVASVSILGGHLLRRALETVHAGVRDESDFAQLLRPGSEK